MQQPDLKKRTKKFALDAIKLVGTLPRNSAGYVLGNQLLRSATSVAANYRSACRGRSKAEFIAKLGVCNEEADESMLWFELLIESETANNSESLRLLKEADELTAIFTASLKTSKGI